MSELSDQLIINIVFQFVQNVVEIGLPFAMQQFNRLFTNIDKFSQFNDVDKESVEMLDEEYLEIVIQLAMVLTFGNSLPLAFFMI